MSTRAQIAVVDLPKGMVKTVYNHFDGGDDLKNELNQHFNADNLARDLVDQTSIRAVYDGEVEYYPDGGAEVIVRGNLDDLAMEFAEAADAGGANWVHFWDGGMWNTLKHRSIRDTYEQLLNLWNVEEAKSLEESYEVKWQKFLAEGDKVTENIDIDKIRDYISAEEGGDDLPNYGLDAYIESLQRDIEAGRVEGYVDFSLEDYLEDYSNYVADRMDS
jgi:hypothetical protein